ncbi:MAG: carboxypeptidase regulatory-like domain-containing protein, partial [Thermoplasmata archaeon]|nr:carboxypeptidase regulatory-like domain-containing protein [Thermoplasmata archaeon]
MSDSRYSVQPAWGLKHFRLVYRTGFWNPYEDALNHSNDWQAVSLKEANEYAMEENGAVLDSQYGVFHGAVMIEYYDGAFLNGTITTEDGQPVPNILVSVKDEYGISHDSVYTDINGSYSLIAPFGELSVIVSTGGSLDMLNMVEKDILETISVNVTDAQSMRAREDTDGDGILDFNILMDEIQIPSGSLLGKVFLDNNNDTTFNGNDEIFVDALVTLENSTYGTSFSTSTDGDGAYEFEDVVPGSYTLKATAMGHPVQEKTVTVGASALTQDLMQVSGNVEGQAQFPGGSEAQGVLITLSSEMMEEPTYIYTDSGGNFEIPSIRPGEYTLSASTVGYFHAPEDFILLDNSTEWKNLTLSRAFVLSGNVTKGNVPVAYANVRFLNREDGSGWSAVTDEAGRYTITLPRAEYEVYCRYASGNAYMALEIYSPPEEEGILNIDLAPAIRMEGMTVLPDGSATPATISFTSGDTTVFTTSDAEGNYVVELLQGQWCIHAQTDFEDTPYAKLQIVPLQTSGNRDIDLVMGNRYAIKTVSQDANGNETGPLSNTGVMISSPQFTTGVRTDDFGEYELFLPGGEEYNATAYAFGYENVELGITPDGETAIQLPLEKIHVSGILATPGHQPNEGRIWFTPEEGMAMDIYALGSGEYEVDLEPGTYTVSLEYNLTSEEARFHYEEELLVGLGYPAVELNIAATKAYSIEGSVLNYQDADKELHIELYGLDGEPLQDKEPVGSESNITFFSHEGEVYLRVFNDNRSRAAMTVLNVSGPQKINLTLEDTKEFTGNVTKSGEEAYAMPIPIYFKDEANNGVIKVTTDEQGAFRFDAMKEAMYAISINYTPEVLVDGAYVKMTYDAQGQKPEAKDIAPTTTPLLVSVTGGVSAIGVPQEAVLGFYAQEGTAVDNMGITSDTSGNYSLSLTPGDYLLHAVSSTHAAVVPVTIPANAVNQEAFVMDVKLEMGYTIGGFVYLTNISGITHKVMDELSIVASEGTMDIQTLADGTYAVLLPSGDYTLSMSTKESEYGMQNTYLNEEQVAVTGDTTIDLKLEKEALYKLSASVDGGQRTLAPGDSATFTETMENTGNGDDRVRLTSSLADWGVTFTPSEFDLPFQGNMTVDILVEVPDDARSDHGPLVVTSTSINDDTAMSSVTLDITVPQTFSFLSEVTGA